MEVKILTVGEMRTNCYLYYDPQTLDCVIIDPGDEADFITEEILRLKLKPLFIVLTHGHYDHCTASLELNLNFNIPIFLDPKDNFLYQNSHRSAAHFSVSQAFKLPPSSPITNPLIKKYFQIIPSPGHTPGSVCLYSKPFLFSGDTLFVDSVGATNHPYSSTKDLRQSLNKIFSLPKSTLVLPGHGENFFMENSLSNNPN